MKNLIILLFFILVHTNCTNKKVRIEPLNIKFDQQHYIIADTIIYDVIIKNPNPFDQWTSECLQYLKKDTLIDFIFNGLYRNKIIAVDYFSHEQIDPEHIKSQEQSGIILREKIGKIQFKEIWTMDSTYSLVKNTYSLIPGQELLEDNGQVRGYKPLFEVILRQ